MAGGVELAGVGVELIPVSGGGGSGTVTTVSVVTANGVSGTVANASTTPAITIFLGAIVPTSVAIGAGSAITSSGPGGALTSLAYTTPGTGVATALGVNVGSAGAFVTFNGALGTPSSGIATNLTGTAAGLTAGSVTTNANLTGVITSVGNATSIASQTGTGTKFVVDTSPTLVTPILGVATGTSLALGGGSIGSDAFEVTGTSTHNGAVVVTPAVNTTAMSITGASITSGTTVPGYKMAATLNTAGIVAGSVLSAAITDTASASASSYINIQRDGSEYLLLRKDGWLRIGYGNATNNVAAALTLAGNNANYGLDFNSVTTGQLLLGPLGVYAIGATSGNTGPGTADTFLTRKAAATWRHGGAAAASPVNQTITAQESRAGTDTNVGGANLTIQSGNGTGTGTTSVLALQAPVQAASGTGAQTETTGLSIVGAANGQVPSVVMGTGAIATNATDGFFYASSGAGTPTGTPTTYTGRVAIYVDTTNAQLWMYLGGAWKQPKTPAGAALVTWQ